MKPNKETELIAAVRTTNSNIDTLNFLCFKAIGCGWYSIGEVADLFKIERSNLNMSLVRLSENGLISYTSYGSSGIVVWWMKSFPEDVPPTDPAIEDSYTPRWTLLDTEQNEKHNIFINEQNEWAEKFGVTLPAFRNFLYKNERGMLGQRYVVLKGLAVPKGKPVKIEK